MRKHNTLVGKLEKNLKCDVCPYETKDLFNMRKHTKRVHAAENFPKVKKSTKCEVCDKTFSRKDYFEKHVKVHHKEVPMDTCKDCDYKYSKSDDLEQHVKLVHKKVKLVKSNAGFGTFLRAEKVKVRKSENLKRHMLSGLHAKTRKKKPRHRTTLMRKVRKFLAKSLLRGSVAPSYLRATEPLSCIIISKNAPKYLIKPEALCSKSLHKPLVSWDQGA